MKWFQASCLKLKGAQFENFNRFRLYTLFGRSCEWGAADKGCMRTYNCFLLLKKGKFWIFLNIFLFSEIKL